MNFEVYVDFFCCGGWGVEELDMVLFIVDGCDGSIIGVCLIEDDSIICVVIVIVVVKVWGIVVERCIRVMRVGNGMGEGVVVW